MEKERKTRVVRKPETLSRTGLSDATLWRLEKMGKFPRRVRLGAQSVGWFEHELETWFATKAKERGDGKT